MNKLCCDICSTNNTSNQICNKATYKLFGTKIEDLFGADIIYCCEKCYVQTYYNLRLKYDKSLYKKDFDYLWVNVGWDSKDEFLLNLKDNLNSIFDSFFTTNNCSA